MGTIELLYAAAAGAGLLKEAVWHPDPAQLPMVAQVGFTAPDDNLLGGLAVGRDYAIVYPATALIGLAARARLIVGDDLYEVREVRAIGDGSERRATLTRIS